MNRQLVLALQLLRTSDLVIAFAWLAIMGRVLTTDQFGTYVVASAASVFIIIAMGLGGEDVLNSSKQSQLKSTFRREYVLRAGIAASVLIVGVLLIMADLQVAGATAVLVAAALANSFSMAYVTRFARPAPALLGLGIGLPVLGVLAFQVSSTEQALLALALHQALRAAPVALTALYELRNTGRDDLNDQKATTHKRRLTLVTAALSGPITGRQLDVTCGAVLGATVAAVGGYGAAYSLATNAATVLVLGIGSTTLPALARSIEDQAALAATYRRYALLALALSVPPLALLLFEAPVFAVAAFGPNQGDLAADYLPWLAACLVVSRLVGGGALNALLTAAHENRRLLAAIFTGAGANAVVNLCLIPTFGMYGAAIGTLCGIVVQGLIALPVMVRLLPHISLLRPQLEVIGAGLLPVAATSVILRNLDVTSSWIAIIASLAGCGAALLLTLSHRTINAWRGPSWGCA